MSGGEASPPARLVWYLPRASEEVCWVDTSWNFASLGSLYRRWLCSIRRLDVILRRSVISWQEGRGFSSAQAFQCGFFMFLYHAITSSYVVIWIKYSFLSFHYELKMALQTVFLLHSLGQKQSKTRESLASEWLQPSSQWPWSRPCRKLDVGPEEEQPHRFVLIQPPVVQIHSLRKCPSLTTRTCFKSQIISSYFSPTLVFIISSNNRIYFFIWSALAQQG